MKKFILTLLTVAGLATEVYAQERIIGGTSVDWEIHKLHKIFIINEKIIQDNTIYSFIIGVNYSRDTTSCVSRERQTIDTSSMITECLGDARFFFSILFNVTTFSLSVHNIHNLIRELRKGSLVTPEKQNQDTTIYKSLSVNRLYKYHQIRIEADAAALIRG